MPCESAAPDTGRPVEPHNFVRSFRRICDDNKIRLIKVHHVRHTVGSLLKDLGVPARDAQTILGHTRISTTLEIYTDTDEQARRDALTRLRSLLGETQDWRRGYKSGYRWRVGDLQIESVNDVCPGQLLVRLAGFEPATRRLEGRFRQQR